jgi:hypothetical protein
VEYEMGQEKEIGSDHEKSSRLLTARCLGGVRQAGMAAWEHTGASLQLLDLVWFGLMLGIKHRSLKMLDKGFTTEL